VNQHIKVVNKSKRATPTNDVWTHLNLDQYLTERGIEYRKAVRKVMTDNNEELNKHWDEATFPTSMLPKIQATGINGLMIKGYGSPGLGYMDTGAINFEMGKVDASFSTGVTIHNAAALSIYEYGDEE
jgi:alkylation response protein AidB-like acyl-CoA dehydrogenase